MKKIFKSAITAILSICVVLSAFACATNEIECEHDWVLIETTQVKTVYECSKCAETKEYNLEFGVKYAYTTTEIIIPETLSIEELKLTLPATVSRPAEVRETMDQIGTLDTVEKYKTVLNKYIETGELQCTVTIDIGKTYSYYLRKPCDGMSVTDNGESYVLTVISDANEASEEVAKAGDSNVLYEDEYGYQKINFLDGKIQVIVKYLSGIDVIFNYEIL